MSCTRHYPTTQTSLLTTNTECAAEVHIENILCSWIPSLDKNRIGTIKIADLIMIKHRR